MNTLEVPLRKIMNPKKRSSLDNDGVILKYKQSKKSNSTPAILEKMINNPGLHHIVEEIFLNLDFKSIVASKLVNKSFQDIVENPFFGSKCGDCDLVCQRKIIKIGSMQSKSPRTQI